jgi:hypothetical protein
MTNEKELRESLGKEIMTEIDFLCDHWVTNDNKAPYSFGGWRGEVQEKLVDIYLSKFHSHTQEVVAKIEGLDDIQLIYNNDFRAGYRTAKLDVLALLKEDNK